MNLTTLNNAVKAYPNRKRKGRGPGSGMGKYSSRGHGGQNKSAGVDTPLGFEGGQTPLYRRLPIKGFNNKNFATKYVPINLTQLNQFDDGTVIDATVLKEAKLVRQEKNGGIKILAKGKLEKKLIVKTDKISKAAQEAIEKLGGKVELVK